MRHICRRAELWEHARRQICLILWAHRRCKTSIHSRVSGISHGHTDTRHMINADVPERNCTAAEGMNLDILPIGSATASTWVLCFQGNEAGPRQTNCHSLTLLEKAQGHTQGHRRGCMKSTQHSHWEVSVCVLLLPEVETHMQPSLSQMIILCSTLLPPFAITLLIQKSSLFSNACLCGDDTSDVCDSDVSNFDGFSRWRLNGVNVLGWGPWPVSAGGVPWSWEG